MAGKNIIATCRFCGTRIARVTTQTLLSHMRFKHKIGDFFNEDYTCKNCGEEVVKIHQLWKLNFQHHVLTKHKFIDFFVIDDHSTIELIEFHCPSCYNRKPAYHFTVMQDRKSFERGWAVPKCKFCGNEMELRRKEEKDKYA